MNTKRTPAPTPKAGPIPQVLAVLGISSSLRWSDSRPTYSAPVSTLRYTISVNRLSAMERAGRGSTSTVVASVGGVSLAGAEFTMELQSSPATNTLKRLSNRIQAALQQQSDHCSLA